MLLNKQIKLGRLHFDFAAIVAFFIIGAAAALRLFFIFNNWPSTNSDEATVGLMALHISQGHDFPAFLYGQGSLGALEAYVGALLFFVLGPSVLALRLGVLLLYVAFLICMYVLTKLLFSKGLALVTLLAFVAGTSEILFRSMPAFAGHAETPLFGALIMLLSTRLGLASQPLEGETTVPHPSLRLTLLYLLWGITCGAAFWNDALAAPFIIMGGLFLLVCCRRTLRATTIAAIMLGLLIGILPMILNDLFSPLGYKSWEVFNFLTSGGQVAAHSSIFERLLASFLVTLPVSSGATAVCTIQNWRTDPWPITSHTSPAVLQCTVLHGIWAGVMVAIWLVAVGIEIAILVRQWMLTRALRREASEPLQTAPSLEHHNSEMVIRYARLMLLGSAFLTWLVFALSSQSILFPWGDHRYLIGLSVATPALLWPLWKSITTVDTWRLRFPPALLKLLGVVILLFYFGSQVIGTVETFGEIAPTQPIVQQQQALADTLMRLHIRHMYSEYWTCNLVAFLTKEQVICSVLDEQLRPGVNRYSPYAAIVAQDPNAAYVFPIGSAQAVTFAQVHPQASQQYEIMRFDNYIMYQPIAHSQGDRQGTPNAFTQAPYSNMPATHPAPLG